MEDEVVETLDSGTVVLPSIQDMNLAVAAASPAYTQHIAEVKTWLTTLEAPKLVNTNAKRPKSTIQPKVVRKHAEWRYAALSEPLHTAQTLFSVKPINGADTDLAKQDAAILDFQFRTQINKVALVDDIVRTAVNEGTVCLQVGWDIKTKVDAEEYIALDDLGNPVVVQKDVESIEYNKPVITLLNYDSYMIDPSAKGNMEKAKYVIVKYITTIMELESKGGYDNLDNIKPSASADFGVNPITDRAFSDDKRNDLEVMEYWGYWDLHKKGELVPVIVTFCQGQILKVQRSPYPFNSLPFVIIQYMPQKNSNYGQPDGYLLEDSQAITGAITRGMIDLLGKSANGQIGTKQGALDPANHIRFQRGEDYTFRPDINPSELVYQHQYPDIPQSALTMLQLQQQEAESLTGVNTFGQGVSSNSFGNGSATAARGAISMSERRESGMLRRIASGLESVAKLIVAMNHKFLEPEFVSVITDAPYVGSQDYSYGVDISISIRTAEADIQSADDLAFLLQTIGNTLDPSFTQMITSKIARLKGLPELADEIANFQPAPDPVAQELQQIQLETAKAELMNKQMTGQLLQAQIASEAEKARKLGSEADKLNLEFIEEESGTNHERAKELLGEQAKANMYHTALKADLEKSKK